MYAKYLLILFLLFSIPVQAKGLTRFPTQEQIEKLCVGVKLTLDRSTHWFYYKHIKFLDERGISIMYGKRLKKINHFDKEEITNFEEAKRKYDRLKREKP